MSTLAILHKHWQALTWKKRLVLVMGLLNIPLILFWTVVVFLGFFIHVEIPFFIHLISWITAAISIVVAITLDENQSLKRVAKEIRDLYRGRHNAAG